MTLAANDLDYLRALVARNSGNLLDVSHDYRFESRLQGLMRARGFASMPQMVDALRAAPGSSLERSVTEAMMIHETSFFREPAAFQLLRDSLLPALIQSRRGSRALRFWCAACSSGQEAYSLAMLLCEHFPQLDFWSIEILGTDLSSRMIARASAGSYSQAEINRGLPDQFLRKYMVPAEGAWEISPALRRLCRFQVRNLCTAPPLPWLYDLVFLRNVLLYFPSDTRERVLGAIHRSLAPDGALFLGAAEQLSSDSQWEAVLSPQTVWYRPIHAH